MVQMEHINVISNLVALARDQNVELEARFGSLTNGRFVPGVTRKKMDSIMTFLQKSPYIRFDKDWNEVQDFFFAHQNLPHRTRVEYSTDTMKLCSHTILKQPLGHVNLVNDADPESDEQIRISVKREKPVIPPIVCNAEYVRIKQTKRFTCMKERSPNVFAFDFAMTWSGRTKTDAESKQQTCEPVYEIECELICRDYLENHDDLYVAESILLKMIDLTEDASKVRYRLQA